MSRRPPLVPVALLLGLAHCSFYGKGAPAAHIATSATTQTAPVASANVMWGPTLLDAVTAANQGRYHDADSVLMAYKRRFTGTREAREIAFWQALLKIDPDNSKSSVADGLDLLEEYLADSTYWYRTEANVMRRLGLTLVAMHSVGGNHGAAARDTSKSREDSIQVLRVALERANAELELIKKRIGKGGKQ